ncbi:class I fructose-bisphosphate aldolase [Aciditerrimonas ferrireducens]|uniref:class I fructose-bisphosphate aldolase n=1 Tax=Aciditerrimonas ferrireducens TaxID=667306 RepID=UPI002004963B|nr:class I fructose-bisphosphate aldolase [Aciditerrimonas ferrireducens]MCK4177587.1 fructose-bisphosphate aldolase class I [Aciditerrimonas ferrireducens]
MTTVLGAAAPGVAPQWAPAEGLVATARAMVAAGKGILAIDETPKTISKRLAAVGIEPSEEQRRAYRALLVDAPGLEQATSGVILQEETVHQRLADGRSVPEALAARGVLPGVKVDRGTAPLALAPGELVTEGLDGLAGRLEEFAATGVRFAKWRAVLRVGPTWPSGRAVAANAHALARYAATCQEVGLVPIVEPEVLMDGDHDLVVASRVSQMVLDTVFDELQDAGVAMEAIVLKPAMVVPGRDGPPASVEEVADATVACLRRCVPAAVPGVAFLSGGQSPRRASEHLAAIVRRGPHPWAITFSFGRALQDEALAAWAGRPEQVAAGQEALLAALQRNQQALLPT